MKASNSIMRRVWTPVGSRVSAFLQSRAANVIERQRVIVYLLHVVLVVTVVSMQFLSMGGSQHALPLTMSGVHLFVCLVLFSLYLARKVTIPQALTLVTLVSQGCIAVRCYFFATTHSDPHYLQLILGNQVTTMLALFFLVLAFVRLTPFIIAAISLLVYGLTAAYLHAPSLWLVFCFFVFVELFVCVLGEVLRRNVMRVSEENTIMHHWESTLIRAVRLNGREIEAYLRMSNDSNPTVDGADRFFAMLTPKSQRNIINVVGLYVKRHIVEGCDLKTLFPDFTKTELDVCKLILQGKKRGEICQLLGKTENNIDVVRTHIRRKLNVPTGQNLQQFLTDILTEKGYPRIQGEEAP